MKRLIVALLTAALLTGAGSCVSAEETAESVTEAVSEAAAEEVAETAAEEVTEAAAEEAADAAEAVSEEAPAEEREWNVLLYLCGTDLESKMGLATENLTAIASTVPNDSVNFLIETGGAASWDPKHKLGFEIANDKLQRYSYETGGFTLRDEVEEANMADSRTLADFIRWAAENYPAKKNLLVLWDHGGGSCAGLICDENYDGTIMPVYGLENALAEGGTHFDLVLTDTCLMASLETGRALAPYADYLVASEEVLAGEGTNYKGWVQYLFDRPDCSAVQLGKRICDTSQQLYKEMDEQEAVDTFTMSLIDLSKMDAVSEAFNAFMHEVADAVQDPETFYPYAKATHYAENYLLNTMYDIFDLSRRAEAGGISKEVTHALQDAVEDAVLYNLRSGNHMYSHGLSFYYPIGEDGKTKDHYARTCKEAEYLSFIDSISMNWEAPAWVYEDRERRPALDRSNYIIKPELTCPEDGKTVYFSLKTGEVAAMFYSYELNYKDPETGVMYTLGESGNLIPDFIEEEGIYRFMPGFDGTWPTLDGKPLCMTIADDTETYALYNIPIKENETKQRLQMRVMVKYPGADRTAEESAAESTAASAAESAAASTAESTAESAAEEEKGILEKKEDEPFKILGFWDGFDAHTGLPGRNVIPAKEGYGEAFTLYDVVYSNEMEKIVDYVDRKEITFSDEMKITPEKLPEGTYQIRFVIRDAFNAPTYSSPVEVKWNGEEAVYSLPK